MRKWKHRSLITLTILILILLIIRLFLPTIILHYVTQQFNRIPDYKVQIAGINLHLIRANYTIKDLKLQKISKGAPVPFFSADQIKLALEWSSLLKGALVGEMTLNHPKLNFVTDPKGQQEQLTISQVWPDVVKALFPLNFNNIWINNGEVHYRSFTSSPPFDIYIYDIQAQVKNIQNVTKSKERLTSSLTAQGKTVGNANVDIQVGFNPFSKNPTFDLTAKMEGMDLSQSNDFLKHYTKLRAQSGIFSFYAEAAAKQGKIVGYVKPLIKNLKIADEPTNNPAKAIYKAAAKVVSKVLENPDTKKIATKIKISGSIDDPSVSVWSLVINILKNAFIQALVPKIDQSIELKDVTIR